MMDDAILLKSSYLKCDACPYVTPPMPRNLTKDDVGTLCPDCGADMLTEADFMVYVAHVAVQDAINTTVRLLNLDTTGERVAVRFHTHRGKSTLTKIDG